jgi:MYXO-CTERM domain-containing protein
VEVRYLADDPQEALLEGCPSSAGTTGVFAAVGPLVVLALGLLRRRRYRRHGHQRDFIDKLRKH